MVAVTLQPGHTYQPYAEWRADIDGLYRAGMGFMYQIGTSSTLACRGATLGF